MSCREIERLFLAGSPVAITREHAASCASCAAAARDQEEIETIACGLRPPAWTARLRESILAIPARTVPCDRADELAARTVESEIDPADRERLDFHLSRCGACAEAAQTLAVTGELVSPRPAPWFAGRVAASVPARPARSSPTRARWRGLLGPKSAIALAYAAALVVMLTGFNPADLALKARADLPEEASTVVAGAKTTLADRVGALEERAVRAVVILRSRVFGYGRAALSNAVALVLKPEAAPSRSRSRNGEEKGAPPKNETSITTWRA